MTPLTLPDPTTPGFPRATLGLPIVFNFIDPQDRTPNRGILEPQSADRMASPVILRAIKLRTGSYFSVAVPLSTLLPEGLKYRFLEEEQEIWTMGPSAYQRKELALYADSPLRRLSEKGSAFTGFLKYLSQNGMEIIR